MVHIEQPQVDRRPSLRPAEAGFTLIELLVLVGCLCVIAAMIMSNLPSARQQTAVAVCESNLRTIQTAAEQYNAATQTYPTGTSADVTTDLFKNPSNTDVTYLGTQPVDPADATGAATYKWTFTAATATVGAFYVVTCPGVHPKETLTALQGGAAETTGTISIDSRKNLYAN
jgi:type II secretory pathway pseudopilin PulG